MTRLHQEQRSRRQAKETQGYIDRIRGMLFGPEVRQSYEDTFTHVKGLMAEPRKQSPQDEKDAVERRLAGRREVSASPEQDLDHHRSVRKRSSASDVEIIADVPRT